MKRKVVDVLLITLVFTACVVKVAPISGQNKENTIQNNTNKENTKENTDKNKSEKVIDRIIDICTKSSKTLLTEDLIYKMIKTLNAKYPARCSKLFKYPEIRTKILQ